MPNAASRAGNAIVATLPSTSAQTMAQQPVRQPSAAHLVEESLRRREGELASNGALVVRTGRYTGRSPGDKFIVDDALTHEKVDWGKVNQAFDSEAFDKLYDRVQDYLRELETHYVFDGYAGADPRYRMRFRVVTEYAWHSLFAHQLLIQPEDGRLSRNSGGAQTSPSTPEIRCGDFLSPMIAAEGSSAPPELVDGRPDFTIIDAANFKAEPMRDRTKSETFILLNFGRRIALIGGTEYAGEIKKSVFSVLNFLLPQQNVFPMHCSANTDSQGNTALFFGLSGTGKTTLSADPERELIGDDEHGWSDYGVFNFEGGCYAKCVGLNAEREPQIWSAIRFGAVLENVILDPTSRAPLYDNVSLTENTRAAYPLSFIPHAISPSLGGHPKTVIFLTADAFGVLPPISRLTEEQAMYHFLSGYTSKLAGTERGVTEPQATFSACFGAPFLPLAPIRYAEMLGERLRKHGATCYLVNTGWTGGDYGAGRRMNLALTRSVVHAALSGALNNAPVVADPIFGLGVPSDCPGVPADVLQPRNTWEDKSAYDRKARELAQRFTENFARFQGVSDAIKAAGPEA